MIVVETFLLLNSQYNTATPFEQTPAWLGGENTKQELPALR